MSMPIFSHLVRHYLSREDVDAHPSFTQDNDSTVAVEDRAVWLYF